VILAVVLRNAIHSTIDEKQELRYEKREYQQQWQKEFCRQISRVPLLEDHEPYSVNDTMSALHFLDELGDPFLGRFKALSNYCGVGDSNPHALILKLQAYIVRDPINAKKSLIRMKRELMNS
jgi:hypothetical protein